MADPADSTDKDDDLDVERLSLDIPRRDYEFLASWAEYKNALFRAENKKDPRKRYTRKQLGEDYVRERVSGLREDIREMVAAVGPLPYSKNPEEMKALAAAYVKKVLAWEAKRSK